jgi:predicted aldo/keto reductase-like oxidoreductase
MSSIDRREFLRRSAGGALALAALARRGLAQDAADPAAAPAAKSDRPTGGLELRELGTTGRKLPRLGLGCAVLASIKSDEKAIALVQRAHELGVRYFDVAPSAGKGRAEELLGKALHGTKRDELWIATKMDERKGDPARVALAASLARLQTDYVDSVHVKTTKDREAASETDSSLDALRQAQEQGVVRHLGLTSSKGVTYAKRAIQRFSYTIALIPVNPSDPQRFNFLGDFLPFAAEKKLAVIGMQNYVTGKKAGTEPLARKDCITYALAQTLVDVIVPRCSTLEMLEEAYAAAVEFKQPTEAWLRDLEARAGKGGDEEGEGEDDDEEDGGEAEGE